MHYTTYYKFNAANNSYFDIKILLTVIIIQFDYVRNFLVVLFLH